MLVADLKMPHQECCGSAYLSAPRRRGEKTAFDRSFDVSFSEPEGASHHSKNAPNSEITCQVVSCLLWKQSTGDLKDGLSCIQPRLDDRSRLLMGMILMWLAIHVAIFSCNLLRVHHGRLDEARLKQPQTLKCGSLTAIVWSRRLGSVAWCGMNEEVNLNILATVEFTRWQPLSQNSPTRAPLLLARRCR